MQIEDDFVAAGAEIVWVLEQDTDFQPGTAASCMDTLEFLDARRGWCVGDGETQPEPGTFDSSPFSVNPGESDAPEHPSGRGFDMIVPISTMTIAYTTNHGNPHLNENITAEELLAVVQEIVAGL